MSEEKINTDSIMTFAGADGHGFKITTRLIKTDEPKFHAKVELLKYEEMKNGDSQMIAPSPEDPQIHMVMALDTISQMKASPDMFEVELIGFDLMGSEMNTPEAFEGMDPALMAMTMGSTRGEA